jgi:hypothetical protein
MRSSTILIYYTANPDRKTIAHVFNGLMAAFMYAIFLCGTAQASQGRRSRSDLKKIGDWPSRRDHESMIITKGLGAVKCAPFVPSAMVPRVDVDESAKILTQIGNHMLEWVGRTT